jgi:fibronectin-binding autotransporter adhesin
MLAHTNCASSSKFTARRNRPRGLTMLLLAAAPVATAMFGSSARASLLTWDSGGASPAAPQDGSGLWDAATDANWSNGTSDVVWDNASTAVIGTDTGAAGTITVNGPINVAGITFDAPGSGDYTVGPDAGSDPLTLTSSGITVNYNGDPTISAPIAGSSGLSFTAGTTGLATLTLSGNNTYTGTTFVTSGLLVVNSATGLGAATNNLQLGPNLVPGAIGTFTTNQVNSVGLVNINANVSVGTLSVLNNSTAANIINIGSGDTLTVSGGVLVGDATNAAGATTAAQVSSLTVNGANGTLDVTGGNFVICPPASTAGGSDSATLNLANLNTFIYQNATGTMSIGAGQRAKGITTLASASTSSSNQITAAALYVGTSGSSNANTGSVLALGQGTNVIDVNTLVIGQGKSSGDLLFSNSSNGSVTIAGASGGATAITIANETSGTATNTTSELFLAGHQATVNAGTITLGAANGNTGGSVSAAMTFSTGSFSASSLLMGFNATGGSGTTAPTVVVSTFTLGTSPASTGVLTIGSPTSVGTFALGKNTNSTTASAVTATFTMLGGTANIYGNITSPSTSSNVTSSRLNLEGGLLNMEGNSIGTSASGNGSVTFTLPAINQSATLENVGAINSSGGILMGAGTLTVSGANSWTGATTVGQGMFILSNGASLGNTAISVAPGANFMPQGTSSAGTTGAGTSGALLSIVGDQLDMADGTPGTFTINQNSGFSGTALTLTGATMDFDLGTTSADELIDAGPGVASVTGTNTINLNTAGDAFLTPGIYDLISAPSGLTGTFDFGNATNTEVLTLDQPYTLTLNNSDTLETLTVSVPEPASIGLLAIGGASLLTRRRKQS